MKRSLLIFFILCFANISLATPLRIVAAENFYGSVAEAIGGKNIIVRSILNNPSQDPHFFGSNPSVAKAFNDADVIIYNGLGYDAWINHLLPTTTTQIIIVADLIHAKDSDNPHIWYKPETSLQLADKLRATFITLDPQNATNYQQNFDAFSAAHQQFLNHIQSIKVKYNGITITATEPIFDYLAESLGFRMLGSDFQLSIMNDVPPSPQQIISFQKNILNHHVKLLVYNTQVNNPITKRMQDFAIQNNIPVVGMSETMPVGKDFLSWMNFNLDAVVNALNSSKSIYGSYHI